MEICVSEMNASDEIMIRTHFSDYTFRVIDPEKCSGVLTGGPLGSGKHEAMFVEAIRPPNCEPRALARLKPGDRAVFLVGRDTISRLTTSVITDIVLSGETESVEGDC